MLEIVTHIFLYIQSTAPLSIAFIRHIFNGAVAYGGFGKWIRNTLTDFKCGAEEECRSVETTV
jgi:hypothetical protein